MTFNWLKRYMPRGLFGRALLILIFPVVTLQLLVSVVFIQRHFEGVTEQMSRGVALELRHVLSEIAASPSLSEGLRDIRPFTATMQYSVRAVAPEDVPAAVERRWYDFSGIVVVRVLQERLGELAGVSMPNDRDISVFVRSAFGPVEFAFNRSRVSASNPHQLLVNMVFFGGLMTVISLLYLRNQLKPITRLGRVAEAFGRGQSLPYHPSGAVEVRAAGNAFLDMRARIDRQIEQRTMMLSGVSHDLRTPLTRLKLGLSMLEDVDRAPLERDVEDMQRLLDEFLNFARGASDGEKEAISAMSLAKAAVADAQRAHPSVAFAAQGKDAVITVNATGMRRALDNLIGNAVRYGTLAEVSVVVSERAVILRVEDDGPGLPPEQYGAAVKPFVRLDPARNQDHGTGVGLGLAITNDIARAHGGSLRFAASARLGGLRADIILARNSA